MIKIKTDTHTHTLASGHAYSTMEENLRAAREQGLELVGITDHFSPFFVPEVNLASFGFFINKKAIPETWYGVRVLFGAEVDIADMDGNLFGHDIYTPYPFREGKPVNFVDGILNGLDYLIASVHDTSFAKNATASENTRLYLNALEHKNVKILGHVGRSGLDFDIDEVVKKAKALGKMMEINEASFLYGEKIYERCKKVAVSCAEHGTQIVVNSDAHSSFYIGKYPNVEKLLEEIDFPEELIANRDMKTFLSAI